MSDRKETFSYVLSAPVPSPSNVTTAKYTSFQFEDKVESLLNVKDVKVYADEAVNNNVQADQMNYTDVSANFNITRDRSCHDSESGSEKCEVISGGFLWTQLLCAYRSADEIG